MLALSAVVLASLGEGGPPGDRLVVMASVWARAGWPAAAYLLGAIGWGVCARPWTRDTTARDAIEAGVGLTLTLSATQTLGVLGLLNPVTAWAWTGLGLAMLLGRLRRIGRGASPLASVALPIAPLLAGAVGVAVMLVAGASPPGVLWDSEFGAYDALSYHLELPAEWLDSGRVEPVTHNVYSYLPGYLEAATVHLAHLAGTPPRTPTGLTGLLTGAGDLVMAPHFLALGLTLLGAWAAGAFASGVGERSGLDTNARRLSALAAGALVLVTPWSQVVGSMAYNEAGVVALGGAGLLASCARGLTPVRRGVLTALLIGGACGCKPTALLFLAPGATVGLLASTPPRVWWRVVSAGAVVGLGTLAPWMLRNWAHGGNPVFPQAPDLFGAAHWTHEQAQRFAGGHRFTGSVIDRALMLVRPDPAASPDAPSVVRWRGWTNPQWALTPWLGLAGCGIALAVRRTHKAGAALTLATLLALLAWMLATHLQSRFLIPLLPLLGAGFGLGVGVLPRPPARALVGVALAGGALWSALNYAAQRGGQPNQLLTFGPGVFSGQLALEGVGDAVAWAGVNETAPAGGLLLVGDATPLYLRRPVTYATVWDTHPLALAMREFPNDPHAWTDALRARGLEWALVSFPELDRLARSAWGDPGLTPERVRAWCDTLAPPARVWPDQGRALFRLTPGDGR